MPDTSVIRITHCRFLQDERVKKCDSFDKVVTVVWTYDQEDHILKYGASVYGSVGNYQYTPKKFNWHKRMHRMIAMDRYRDSPIVINNFIWSDLQENDEKIGKTIDRVISKHLVTSHGTGKSKDIKIVRYYESAYKRGYHNGVMRRWNERVDTSFSHGLVSGIVGGVGFSALVGLVGLGVSFMW